MDWQPIATAPKQVIVLVWTPLREMEGFPLQGCIDMAALVDDAWVGNGHFDPRPTHWMPLPTPPEAE